MCDDFTNIVSCIVFLCNICYYVHLNSLLIVIYKFVKKSEISALLVIQTTKFKRIYYYQVKSTQLGIYNKIFSQ